MFKKKTFGPVHGAVLRRIGVRYFLCQTAKKGEFKEKQLREKETITKNEREKERKKGEELIHPWLRTWLCPPCTSTSTMKQVPLYQCLEPHKTHREETSKLQKHEKTGSYKWIKIYLFAWETIDPNHAVIWRKTHAWACDDYKLEVLIKITNYKLEKHARTLAKFACTFLISRLLWLSTVSVYMHFNGHVLFNF